MSMTGSPFTGTPIDMTRFCCADTIVGGCGHELSEHTGPAGECDGVFGCSCTRFRKHKKSCIHNSGGEVSADDEA